jgi:hypothetical protein
MHERVPVLEESPEDWGWHGEMGRWGRRLWLIPFGLVVGLLAIYVFGPSKDLGADIWLGAVAALMALFAFVDRSRRRNAWRTG